MNPGTGPCALVLLLALALAAPAAAGPRQRAGNLDAFVVLDESGSMKPIFGKVIGYLGDALVTEYLQPGDYFLLLGFSDVPHVRVGQRISSAAEKENVARMVRDLNVVPSGYTDMGRALEEVTRQLEALADPSHQQVLLILTDGLNQPPRDSPYYSPARPDKNPKGLAPPSTFNEPFRDRVKLLAARGWRIHVVGIGQETDARTLGEALGTSYTLLREWNAEELQQGLAGFWDDTVDLSGLEGPAQPCCRPGQELAVAARLVSTSAQAREIHLGAPKVARLKPLGFTGTGADPKGITVTPAARVWAVGPKQSARQELRLRLPEGFPAGDYEAELDFDQQSAARFYPPTASFSFHVPSWWELNGRKVIVASAAALVALIALVLYRRRAVPIALVVDGQPDAGGKPVSFAIGGACTVGGGATDRLRVTGLPQKSAVFERRSVSRFALVSTQPELLPTLLEYSLGQPVEVRTGLGPGDRQTIRFVRAGAAARASTPRPRPPLAPSAPSDAAAPGGGIDFR